MSEMGNKTAEFSAMIENNSATGAVERTLERFLEVAQVKSVYGKPLQHGENLIIPAAEVLGAFGFGMGSGVGFDQSPAEDEEEETAAEAAETETPSANFQLNLDSSGGGGGGGGGGGRVFARPVAVIISGPDGVEVQPVMDVTKVALAFFTALGFMFAMAGRMRRGPHR